MWERESDMTDEKILDLFFSRSQQALEEVRDKYGGKLLRLAHNILGNCLDAEECVNDALLAAWSSIPPKRPMPLLPWLYSTTRNISMNRLRINSAQKRGSSRFCAALDELDDIFPDPNAMEDAVDGWELARVLNKFLGGLSKRDRSLFLGRYYSGETYRAMAERLDMTEHNCQVRASRLRKKLETILKKEGLL